MSLPSSLREWLRLPSRVALLLGLGALSATATQANATRIDLDAKPERVPQQSGKGFGELAVWSESGRVYVSESGKPARELQLGDTAEARRLKELLERDGATADSPRIVPDRMILVGGGGSGIGWVPADKNRAPATPTAPAAAGSGPPATGFGPNTPNAPAPRVRPKNLGVPTADPQRNAERG
jgi:hypothetical protein